MHLTHIHHLEHNNKQHSTMFNRTIDFIVVQLKTEIYY